MKTVLLVDAMNICYRSRYSTGQLEDKNTQMPVGVIFGFLRDVFDNMDGFGATHVLIAFDGKNSKRREIYPDYKINRKKVLTTEEEKDMKIFFGQVDRLHYEILPKLGFNNVLEIEGFEADDLIAKAAADIAFPDQGVILTNDQDLFQCISRHVCFKNPNKPAMHFKDFVRVWGMHPGDWGLIKAVCGCSSDGIKGVDGIGVKRAVKWLKDDLNKASPMYNRISKSRELINRNYELTSLPFDGTPDIVLTRDHISQEKRAAAFDTIGMDQPSRISRRKKRIKRMSDIRK